jgi:hypothetical protein
MSSFTPRRENGRSRPRGYADWRPQLKSRVILDQVQLVLAEYQDHLPITVRQVFYRLVGAHGYPKTEKAYKNLCELMGRARRARVIDFSDVRDDGTTVWDQTWWESPDHFVDSIRGQVDHYQRDRQQGQDYRLELWCEAAGMMPQLARIASRYSIPVYTAGGFLSLSAIRHVVDRARNRNHATVLLHVGDRDPSGESIFTAFIEDAQAFLKKDRLLFLQEIIPERVAVTREQIEAYRLDTSPPKASDSRSANFDGDTCQVEALAPDDLAFEVDMAIRGWIDIERWQVEVEQEAQDRIDIRALMPGAST